MPQVDSRPLFKVNIEVGAPATVGNVPHGFARRVVPITGGSFAGERLKGRVLAGGGDTILVRADGAAHLDVRLTLETDAGEAIYMTYSGRRVARAQGDYFRVAVQFETASESLKWLNDILAVGYGTREPTGPVYEVVEIL
ncbi:MAG: DUF3237 domain-containing protein [Burkholderiaceae bacterium]|nr:DUF3237 domain-containing protein [Burkholderiaceae bacterium]